MTKREAFEKTIEIVRNANVVEGEEIIEKIQSEIEQLAKKRTGLTKNQKANLELVEKVFEVMQTAGKEMTIAEIFKEMQDVEGITSPNKVSALVKKLKDTKRVVRIDNGKDNVTFKIQDDDNEEDAE